MHRLPPPPIPYYTLLLCIFIILPFAKALFFFNSLLESAKWNGKAAKQNNSCDVRLYWNQWSVVCVRMLIFMLDFYAAYPFILCVMFPRFTEAMLVFAICFCMFHPSHQTRHEFFPQFVHLLFPQFSFHPQVLFSINGVIDRRCTNNIGFKSWSQTTGQFLHRFSYMNHTYTHIFYISYT